MQYIERSIGLRAALSLRDALRWLSFFLDASTTMFEILMPPFTSFQCRASRFSPFYRHRQLRMPFAAMLILQRMAIYLPGFSPFDAH